LVPSFRIGCRVAGWGLRIRDVQSRATNSSSSLISERRAVPPRVDVAIVGGGIVGLATAHSLARRGVSVALFEKGRLGGEQSSRNWGWCRKFGRDRRELPLAERSMRLWRELFPPRGSSPVFHACGILYLASNDAQAERHRRYLDDCGLANGDARQLSNGETERLLPGAARKWASALYSETDGRADPDLAVAALAEAAEREGALLFPGCAARGFETNAGRVSAIVTERGRTECQSLVVAAGAWSSLFLARHGLSLPQVKIISSVLSTGPVVAAPRACVFGDGFTFGRERDGGYVVGHGGIAILPLGPEVVRFAAHFLPALRQEWNFVRTYVRVRVDRQAISDWRDRRPWRLRPKAPFERRRALSPEPALDILDDALLRLRSAFPAFHGSSVRRRWAGVMDVTPDAIPVISKVDEVPGLVLGTGFSGHGFGLAPGAGEALADLATDCAPALDLAPFHFSRFSNGSALLPGARF
jgi:glycine/D-amino acid oxidase-like deaminating enzyme